MLDFGSSAVSLSTGYSWLGIESVLWNSNYHSLQTEITNRLTHGVQMQGAYTWSHAIDDWDDR
jgi:hypothetical protein